MASPEQPRKYQATIAKAPRLGYTIEVRQVEVPPWVESRYVTSSWALTRSGARARAARLMRRARQAAARRAASKEVLGG